MLVIATILIYYWFGNHKPIKTIQLNSNKYFEVFLKNSFYFDTISAIPDRK